MYQKSACVIVVDEGRVLSIIHARFGPSLPGGKVEPGELFSDAAYRECVEETGYRTERLTPLFDHYDGTYWCRIFSARLAHDVPLSAAEYSSVRWSKPADLLTSASHFREAYIEAFALLGLV